ncbi:hypothetical protein VaNZ11_001087 [Volvox africanus]|uniref:Uncharacterized protein n=1 Tax=Volvox africanus TaxID=51714 RepID=A0ABQ5RQ63_9CHLO|nr:hypothetical protein VaNZ11_001087 [Volvox africanus]
MRQFSSFITMSSSFAPSWNMPSQILAGGLSLGVSPSHPYNARHGPPPPQWAGITGDSWRTSPGMHRSQRNQPTHRRAREHLTPDSAASSPVMLRHTGQSSTMQMSVEAFVRSLPLGDDPDAAEIEARVAARLYEEEAARAMLQEKLRQWSEVAMELFTMISELRAARGSAATPENCKPDTATLSAIKSAITSFMLEQQRNHQKTLEYDLAGDAMRRTAAPPGVLDGSVNTLDTPTVHHHHHAKQQPSQPHFLSDGASVYALSSLHCSGPRGGHGDELPQLQDDDEFEDVMHPRQVSRLRSELARDRAGGAGSRHSSTHAASDYNGPASGEQSRSPTRVLSAGMHVTEHKALAVSAAMQAALMPKVQFTDLERQETVLADALRVELEAARVASAERGAQAIAAGEEAQRLRRALLDAEIELQQATVVGDAARKQLAQAEEEAATLRASNGRLAADLEAERAKTIAVETVVRQQLSQALSDLELCRAQMASKDVEMTDLSSRLVTRTSELAAAMQQIADMRSAMTEVPAQHAEQLEREGPLEQLQGELIATREELCRLQVVLAKPYPDTMARKTDDSHLSWVQEPDVLVTLRIRLERLQALLEECQRTLLDEQLPLRRQCDHQYEQISSADAQGPGSPTRAADHLGGALRDVEDLRQQLVAALAAAVAEREAQTQAHEEEVQGLQLQVVEARAVAADDVAMLRQQLADADQAAATLRAEADRLRQQLEAVQEVVVSGGRETELLRQKLDKAEAGLEAALQARQELLDRLVDADSETEARRQELDDLRDQLNQVRNAAEASGQETEDLRRRLEDDRTQKAMLQKQVDELRRQLVEAEKDLAQGCMMADSLRKELVEVRQAEAAGLCDMESLKDQLEEAKEVAEKNGRQVEEVRRQLVARAQEASGLRKQLAAAEAVEAAISLQADDLRKQLAAANVAAAIGSREIVDLRKQLDAAKEEVAVSCQQVDDLRSQLAVSSDQLEDLQRQLVDAREAAEAGRCIEDQLQLQLAELKAQLEARQEQLDDLQRCLSLMEDKAEKSALEVQNLGGLLQAARTAAEKESRETEQLRQQLSEAEFKAAIQAQELDETRCQLEAQLEASLREAQSMRQQLQDVERVAETRDRDADELRRQLSTAREAATGGLMVIEEMQRRLTEAQASADASAAEVASLRGRLADSEQLAEAADREVGELRRQMVVTTAALEAQVLETETLRSKTTELQSANDQRLAELHQRVLKAKQAVEERGRDLVDLRERLAEKQAEAEASSCKLQELRGQLADAVRSLEEREQEAEELRWHKADLQALVEAKDRAADELRREYAAAVAVAEGASRDMATASRLEAGELRRQLAAAKDEMVALGAEVEELRHQLIDAEQAADAAHAETETLQQRLTEAEKVAEVANAEADGLRNQLTEARAEAGAANKDAETLRRTLAELSKQVADGGAEVVELAGRLKAAEEVADTVTRDSNEFCEQLRDQLARAQEEARLLGKESDRIREQLTAAQEATAATESLRHELLASQNAVATLSRKVKILQQQMDASQREAAASGQELAALQRELVSAREATTAAANGSRETADELRQQLAAAQAAAAMFRQEGEDLRLQVMALRAAAGGGSKEVDDLMLHLAEAQSEAVIAIRQVDELYQQMEAAHVAVLAAVREVDELRQRLVEGQQQYQHQQRLIDEQARAYEAHPAKQMLAHQAQVLAQQAVEQHTRVIALQRQLEGVHSSLATLAGRSQELVRENAGLRCQLQQFQRTERVAGDAEEQAQDGCGDGGEGRKDLADALDAERSARTVLEGLVSELRKQLDGARVRAGELQQRAAAADAARLEAMAKQGAAVALRSDMAAAMSAHVAEVERRPENARQTTEQTIMSQQDGNVSFLERQIRDHHSVAGLGGGALAAVRSLERDMEVVGLATPSRNHIADVVAGGRASQRSVSDEMSTPQYSFDDDVPQQMMPGSPAWTGVSEVLQALVSSDGLSSQEGAQPSSSETGRPDSVSLPTDQEAEHVVEAKEMKENTMLRLKQFELQQQLVEMGEEVAGLQKRLSQQQVQGKVQPATLLALQFNSGTMTQRSSGGDHHSGDAITEPNAAPFGSVTALPRSSPSGSAEASPVRGLGSGLSSRATLTVQHSINGSGLGQERDGRGSLPMEHAERRWGLSQPAGVAIADQPLRRFGAFSASLAYPEVCSPVRQRQSGQSYGYRSLGSLQEDEAAAAAGQSPGPAAADLDDNRSAVEAIRDGWRLGSVVSRWQQYGLAESITVANDDGPFDSGSVRDHEASCNAMKQPQCQHEWLGERPRQLTAHASGSSGGSSFAAEGQDPVMAAAVITLGSTVGGKELAEVAIDAEDEAQAGLAPEAHMAVAAGRNATRMLFHESPVPSISELDKDLTDLRDQLKQLDSLLLSQRSRPAAATSPSTGTASARDALNAVNVSIPAPDSPGAGLWTHYMTAAVATLEGSGPDGTGNLPDGSCIFPSTSPAASVPAPGRQNSALPLVRMSQRSRPATGEYRSLEAETGLWRTGNGGRVGDGSRALRMPLHTMYPDESQIQGLGSGPLAHAARRT